MALFALRGRAVITMACVVVATAGLGAGMDSATGATPHSTVPVITQGTPLQLSGASLWLHAVVDDQNRVVLSASQSGNVEMAYFNPDAPTSSPSWLRVITPSMLGTTTLSDNWHIYADGHHWIVVAGGANGNSSSWLFELDDNFNVVNKVQVVNNGQPASTSVKVPNSSPVATNDMFLVAEPNGITVGHFLPPNSNRLFQFNLNLQLQSITDIGGEQSSQYAQSNEASAFATSSGFTVIAPTTAAPNQQSKLMEFTYDSNWNPLSATTMLSAGNTNFSMGTAVSLSGGDMAVTARVISPLASSPSGSDNGNIVRYIFDSSGNQLSSTPLITNGAGNRPHTLLFNGTDLITGWDNGGGAVTIEVDSVTGGTTTTSSSTSTTSTTTTAPPTTTTTLKALAPRAPSIHVSSTSKGVLSISLKGAVANGGSPITRYQYSLGGKPWINISKNSHGVFVISHLSSGKTYSVRLRAINGAGAGASSSAVKVKVK
jgi:hypothetical protein